MNQGVDVLRDLDIIRIDTFCDESVCDDWIERAEEVGFETGPIFTPDGERVAIHIRDCLEAVFEDEESANALTSRLRERFAGSPWLDGFVGLHPRLRVFRYGEDQKFSAHTDAHILSDDGASESAFTLLVYLNDDYEGGQTEFPDEWGETLSVEPSRGQALVFDHDLLHEGRPIDAGTKYILRADLLFETSYGS